MFLLDASVAALKLSLPYLLQQRSILSMRPLPIPVFVALAQLATIITAAPVADPAIILQGESGVTAAPLPFTDMYVGQPTSHLLTYHPSLSKPPRSSRDAAPPPPHRLLPRVITITATNNPVQVLLSVGVAASAEAITDLLNHAYDDLIAVLQGSGDGVIPEGTFQSLGPQAMQVLVWNANNHQTTYGVCAAALGMLRGYMAAHGATMAEFLIRDGQHVVGRGRIFKGTG